MLNLDLDEFLKTPKTRQPQSPGEAAALLGGQQQQHQHQHQHQHQQHQHQPQAALLSPFARRRGGGLGLAPAEATPGPAALRDELPVVRRPSAMPSGHHRTMALGALPAALTAALRQRELQPQPDPCSFGCGVGAVAWAAMGSTLYVWRAAAPQGCRRLASPLPSELAAADLVCEVQPGSGAADSVLLLVCWASRSSCRLALYQLEALSLQPPISVPTPIAEASVPLPSSAESIALRPTPGTVLHATGSSAAAVLGTTAGLFAVVLGVGGSTMQVVALQRDAGVVSSILTTVKSYFVSAPTTAPGTSALLKRLALASDWLVTLSAPAAAAAAVDGAHGGADDEEDGAVVGAEGSLDVWRRGGAGQSYEHAGSHQVPADACDLALIPQEAGTGCTLLVLVAGVAPSSFEVSPLEIACSRVRHFAPRALEIACSRVRHFAPEGPRDCVSDRRCDCG